MTTRTEYELIQTAIKEKHRLLITVKTDLGSTVELALDPYIFGKDTWQRHFVWGLDSSLHCYKYYVEWIEKVKLEGSIFKVDPNAVYYYSQEEEHIECVENPEVMHQAYSDIAGNPADDVAAAILKRKG